MAKTECDANLTCYLVSAGVSFNGSRKRCFMREETVTLEGVTPV